jgi:hypothetical protein
MSFRLFFHIGKYMIINSLCQEIVVFLVLVKVEIYS